MWVGIYTAADYTVYNLEITEIIEFMYTITILEHWHRRILYFTTIIV